MYVASLLGVMFAVADSDTLVVLPKHVQSLGSFQVNWELDPFTGMQAAKNHATDLATGFAFIFPNRYHRL